MTESELIERLRKSEKQNQRFRTGGVLFLLSFALVVFIGQSGCTNEQSKQASSPPPVIVQPYQRFVPIAHGQGFLSFPYWAFDTQTGQLCKTWDWQSDSVASQKAKESGNTSKLQGLDAAAAYTPTCKQLWTGSNKVSIESPTEWLKKYRAGKEPSRHFGPAQPPKSK